MSDYIIKIVPRDPFFRIDEQRARTVVRYLAANVKADAVEAKLYGTPAFIDCGSDLESVSCPHRHAILGSDWWGREMDRASEDDLTDLSVKLPCCDMESTLDDLIYDSPCGFSSVEFDITDPSDGSAGALTAAVGRMLGTPMRIITAHH